MAQEVATLGGGCFWCIEAVFDELKGVTDVVSGYTGGEVSNPTYEQVCTGDTGHAEVVRVTFDNEVITFADLLDVFFTVHDPTTLNRQGNDIGTQYRSSIFFHSPEQQTTAYEKIAQVNDSGWWANPVVTEVVEAGVFYPAEGYHQEFFANNPSQPYCAAVVAPKVAKFRKQHLARLKA